MEKACPAHLHDTHPRDPIGLAVGTSRDEALTTLTAAERLSRQLADQRWPTAFLALQHGATLAAIASAIGDEDVEWIGVAMTAWAEQQLREGHLDRAEYDRLTAPLTA